MKKQIVGVDMREGASYGSGKMSPSFVLTILFCSNHFIVFTIHLLLARACSSFQHHRHTISIDGSSTSLLSVSLPISCNVRFGRSFANIVGSERIANNWHNYGCCLAAAVVVSKKDGGVQRGGWISDVIDGASEKQTRNSRNEVGKGERKYKRDD